MRVESHASIRVFCPNEKTLPDPYDRIDWLNAKFAQFIREQNPAIVSYEVPFVGQDPQVAIKFGHIGGCIRSLAGQIAGCQIYALAPTTIKMHTTGSGAADKVAMIWAIQELLNIPLHQYSAVRLEGKRIPIDMASHVADAAGAAYTAAVLYGNARLMAMLEP